MRLYEEFGLSVSDDTIYRALKKLGFSHMSARPKAYKQNAEAMEAFKKEIRAALAPGTPLEVWFQDEMRVGQKNKLTYRWARKGSRPRAAHDQRTQSTYLFGAVCPERGAGAALALPACNCEAMQLHLDEIRRAHPSSTARKTSGSSCVRIGCQTGSSNPPTISSTTAAMLGIHPSTNPGRSCPSRSATGQQSVTQSEDWY
jgi:hypothetical protein